MRDLLTFRMGFGSVMAAPGTYPLNGYIRELRIGGDGPPRPTEAPGTEEWLRRLGSLPLMAQPGERWMYHVSCDVLGVLIARVTGQSLGAFMRQRIFEPLGMRDTAFHVPAEKIERLPTCYSFNHQIRSLDVYDDAASSAWRRRAIVRIRRRRAPVSTDRRPPFVQPDDARTRGATTRADPLARCGGD